MHIQIGPEYRVIPVYIHECRIVVQGNRICNLSFQRVIEPSAGRIVVMRGMKERKQTQSFDPFELRIFDTLQKFTVCVSGDKPAV